jgi:SEC-C motif
LISGFLQKMRFFPGKTGFSGSVDGSPVFGTLTTQRTEAYMNPMKRAIGTRRNDRCICGSGKKYKYCCHPQALEQPQVTKKKTHYIDTGEAAVRYVICDGRGTSFFVDKDSRIIVFSSKPDAIAVATMDEFNVVEPGEINVAGVGPTKWEHIQKTLPFVEVENAEMAVTLVRERIQIMQAKICLTADSAPPVADATTSPAQPENG